jgi:hypothetical protein
MKQKKTKKKPKMIKDGKQNHRKTEQNDDRVKAANENKETAAAAGEDQV